MIGETAFGSQGQSARFVAQWWHQPDQFDWLSGYLHARGLAMPARLLMALISAALIFMAFGVLASPGQSLALSVPVSVIAVVAGVGYSVLWLRGWPTKNQSLSMGVVGGALIAIGSVMQSEPVVALMGCTGLAIIGGYLAFFHNTKAIVYNVLVAVAAGAVCAARVVAAHQNAVDAAAGLWLVIELNIAVPLAIQTVVRTLGADVVRSDQDALTGVLNRRAFYERATTLLTAPSGDLQLVVAMIDLDNFKKLNDTYGHIAGDQALTAVGWALRQSCAERAIVGRAGGEEFLVIDTVLAEEAARLPAQLCAAIAALPQPVTASVGAAVVHWDSFTNPNSAIQDLIKTADAAMYEAKRNGGNQALVTRPAALAGDQA